jgi:hypothetical protein
MRIARAMLALLGIAVVPMAAPSAGATPIAVAFAGTFSHLSGSPASIPFAGTLFYDPATPNTSVTPPYVLFEFAPGTAGIRIETAEAVYASDPASADLVAHSLPVWLDANGNPVSSPNDPDAVTQGSQFHWSSFGSNVPSSVHTLQIAQLVLVVEPPLPDSASALADELVGSSVVVGGEAGFALSGAIASAVPIPEPSSAALLALGLTVLALRGARRHPR